MRAWLPVSHIMAQKKPSSKAKRRNNQHEKAKAAANAAAKKRMRRHQGIRRSKYVAAIKAKKMASKRKRIMAAWQAWRMAYSGNGGGIIGGGETAAASAVA